jgi:tRNA threonylcarbamoyl adenosine modification protein YeaZ
MKILAIDTSQRAQTVVLIDGDKNYIDICAAPQAQSVLLMPSIDGVLRRARLATLDIDVFGCVIGPGSFTGIRVGISTIKGLAFADGKPIVAVNSNELIAYNVSDRPKKFLTAIDALRGCYYVACFNAALKCLSEPRLQEGEEIKNQYGGVEIFYQTEDVSRGLVTLLNKRAAARDFVFCDGLTPLYIRRSQAEEAKRK